MENNWRVFKFGGTSLKDASMFKRVAAIVAESGERPLAVVVSAMAGITDSLMALGRIGGRG